MNEYAIMRRNAWKTPTDLEKAAGRSSRVANEEMPDRVRWIRSYVIQEDDGSLGSICVYQAADPAAASEHAERAGIACSAIHPITRTVVINPDPTDRD